MPGGITANRPHPAVAGYWLAAALWIGAILVGLIPAQGDAMNYYNHLEPAYAVTDYASGAGFYYAPPALALAIVVSWAGPQVFYAACVALGLIAVGWIGGKWAVALLFFPPVWWDITAGNVNTVIGACSIAMLARPGLVAIPLFTKVTPGIVGLWWVARREKPQIETAAIWVLGPAVATFVFYPDWWIRWVQALVSNGTAYIGPGYFTIPVPLLPRLALAVLLVVWGARKSRRWVLPAAACLAMPVMWWSVLAALAAIVRSEGWREGSVTVPWSRRPSAPAWETRSPGT